MWGTLGANIIIHPKTIKQLGPDLENIISELKYGSIGINTWCAMAFLTAECTWGAFPGHATNDIQSGNGVVHNTRLFDKPEKTVVLCPIFSIPQKFIKRRISICFQSHRGL
ncbi:MAG: hypothetical protein Ct9H300mP18_11890 [Candidatus Neomarinimicrobiota bacterium]|nr:MAG: hypothetical protein Ct9H300mP18_11890 [Candidatus Neomarinimicrobiota bacterium]